MAGVADDAEASIYALHFDPELVAIAACTTPPGSACCSYGGSNSCLYNSQIAPYTVGPTGVSAFLWYQGEQNAGCGGPPQLGYYGCGLAALIADWRAKFKAPAGESKSRTRSASPLPTPPFVLRLFS